MSAQFDFGGELARASDPVTSHMAAKAFQRGSQRARILWEYGNWPEGLTDEEAAFKAGIRGGWKRCSDLRNMGLIEPTGETKESEMGAEVMICRITFSGKRMLGLIDS